MSFFKDIEAAIRNGWIASGKKPLMSESAAGDSASLGGETAEQWQTKIDVEKARIDTFTSLPAGSTAGNAELADIRVGADGTTYSSAGNAVREQITKISNEVDTEIAGVKSDLIEYGAVGTMLNDGEFVNKDVNGISYTWNGNVCNAKGTATSTSFVTIYENKNGFPFGIEAGKTYPVFCNTTNPNLYAQIRYYVGESSTAISTYTENGTVTIPENATGLWVRLMVATGQTVNDTISVDILTELSNTMLKELTQSRTRGNEEVTTNYFVDWTKNVGALEDGTVSLIDDMPLNTIKYAQSSKIKKEEIEGAATPTGATWIEKRSDGNLSYYRMQRNADGRESIGFIVGGSFEWFNRGARKPVSIAMFGDSVTNGAIGGGGYNTNHGIPYYVGLQTGAKVTNFAVGSMGWIAKKYIDTNAEEHIKTQDLTGYDIVTLMFGLNDTTAQLGEYTDTTEETIMGTIYRICEYLGTTYPKMKIILISPSLSISSSSFPGWGYSLKRGNGTWSFEDMLEQYKQFGARYHIPIINGGNCFNSWNVTTLIGDNVHPTQEGYDILGPYIAGQISSLI